MGEDREDRWPVLQLIPVAWLLLVLVAYGLVAFAPADDPTAPVPGLAVADRIAGPLLAALLLAGIIRRFTLRRVLGLLPAVWLLLVVSVFGYVAFAPAGSPTLATGLVAADRVAGPLLAALLLTGIIRYFSLRRESRQSVLKTPSGQG